MADTTTLQLARQAVNARWVSRWGTTATYTFENEKLVPPSAMAASSFSIDTSTWLRVTVKNLASAQETLGPVGHRKFQRQAEINIQVFVPVDRGTADADTLAMQARSIFEGAEFNGVCCYAGLVREVGPDGRWFRVDVIIPFTYWETL